MSEWMRNTLNRFAQPASSADPNLLQFFKAQAAARAYTLSTGQQQVVQAMAERVAELDRGAPRGLYIHGAVGRGKSWLLDGFFQALAEPAKRRLHFHDFFARLHQGMFRHREHDDALAATLDELIGDCRVLCFDEFHVHDIGDAMLLKRLFSALFERSILVLLTSNYAPAQLLPNPLYHERFLPVIELIGERMQVLELDGDTDFRSLPANRTHQRFTRGHYLYPGTPEQRQRLAIPQPSPCTLTVNRRALRALACEPGQVMFAFDDLCQQPTAVIDYLALARDYPRWIIDGLIDLGECSLAAQQRFVNLVDVLYDQDIELLVIGRKPLAESLHGGLADLMRTRSRLGQLQPLG
ncbi:cell division protein ZapE [Pseudomonas cremoricolorata]|uniref:cell division protein ZapE n=1 Tax=Pseudomonas cremoricolorata TaxID=157783 RepID=UPI00040C5091